MSGTNAEGRNGGLSAGLDRTQGATWIHVGYHHWALKAGDGELLAELTGGYADIWHYKGKRYHELRNAKAAVLHDVGPKTL